VWILFHYLRLEINKIKLLWTQFNCERNWCRNKPCLLFFFSFSFLLAFSLSHSLMSAFYESIRAIKQVSLSLSLALILPCIDFVIFCAEESEQVETNKLKQNILINTYKIEKLNQFRFVFFLVVCCLKYQFALMNFVLAFSVSYWWKIKCKREFSLIPKYIHRNKSFEQEMSWYRLTSFCSFARLFVCSLVYSMFTQINGDDIETFT